jgi:hypothetical protein
MSTTDINDIRTPAQFKGVSFSKYKKTEVKKQFVENMMKGKIEPACNWCAELICAGHFEDVWESIFYFVGKHIHVGNPKIIVYLDNRYNVFRNIFNQGHFSSELQLRNNPTIRSLFAEVITMITMSVKRTSVEPVRINRSEEFDMTQMTERLKAPNVNFASQVVHPEDPKELFIAINEFAFNIGGERPNMLQACYWLEWVIEFDIICRRRKEPCLCKRRKLDVENKYQRDIIWIVWDALVYYSEQLKPKNPFIEKTMGSIKRLFCSRYTTGASKRRKYLLYFAIELLTESVPMDVEMMSPECKQVIQNVTTKIDLVYKQIKKNEDSPNTDYLFSNIESQNNLDNSIKKMDTMSAMDFIPRQGTYGS